MNKLGVSLILPAYNEGKVIDEVISRVDRVARQMELDYELIVVDDGSVDETRSKVVNYANNNHHVRVMSFRKNLGKGYAMKTGFAHACGDVVIFLDSDLEINPMQISQYVRALQYGDLVVASKRHPQSRVQVPLMRKFLSYGFNVLVKLLTGLRLGDTQTGLKAVRRKALKKVFSRLSVKRFAFDVELLAAADHYRLKIVELPVNIRLTCGSFSLREVWRMFIDLLGITYRLRVLKWYQRC